MSALYGKLYGDTKKCPATSRSHKKIEAELFYGSKNDSRRALRSEIQKDGNKFIVKITLPDGKYLVYELEELSKERISDKWRRFEG